MSKVSNLIIKARGLNTQPNELDVPEGSLRVAENVEITRDGVVQLSPGFSDLSTNLPDFKVQQLFSYGGTLYAITDNGVWYFDGSNWLRKRGSYGSKLVFPSMGCVSNGHLYYSDNACVWDLNISTGRITLLAGRFGITGDTDGTGAAARFNTPFGMCSDGTNLFVTDIGRDVIRQIVIATGVVTTLAGTPGVTGSTDGTGAAASFNNSVGICTDGTNLYTCDTGTHIIRKIVISSAVVTTLAGTAGATGTTDATGAAARFSSPRGICTDNTNLYICDSANNKLAQVVISSAVKTTICGSGAAGHTDSNTGSSTFRTPYGICLLGSALYIGDSANNCIRKFTPISGAGFTTTIAGTATGTTFGSTDGIGNASRFTTPRGVQSDGTDLYVWDNGNKMLRKVYVSTGYTTTLLGTSAYAAAVSPESAADSIVVGPA